MESGLQDRQCRKNPGHPTFIPAQNFNLGHVFKYLSVDLPGHGNKTSKYLRHISGKFHIVQWCVARQQTIVSLSQAQASKPRHAPTCQEMGGRSGYYYVVIVIHASILCDRR